MKQCPRCRTAYTDDTLRFCLADGTLLSPVADEEPTLVSGRRDNVPVDFQRGDPASFQPHPTAVKSGTGRWVKIIIAVLLLGFGALGAVGLAGAYFYYNLGRQPAVVVKSPTPTATPAPSSTPDLDKQLEEAIANIQKQLEETQNPPANSRPFPTDTDEERGSSITARVNSPNDGFLALRNAPDPDKGRRVAKIPHGEEVEIHNCEKNQVTIAGRAGRWCQVEYGGDTGWVFDAWLEY